MISFSEPSGFFSSSLHHTRIYSSLHLPEDGADFVVQALSAVSHIEDLEGLLDSDATLEGLVIHEELDQVEELPRLETSLIVNAPFVHCVILIATHVAV